MAIAYGPGKALLSTAFMLWMSGSSVQIFSIMMTGMALVTPIKGLLSLGEAFKGLQAGQDKVTDAVGGVDLRLPYLIYSSLQLLALGVAVYKCSTMGLLPLTSADWVDYLPVPLLSHLSASPIP
jgi:hypothetical protein